MATFSPTKPGKETQGLTPTPPPPGGSYHTHTGPTAGRAQGKDAVVGRVPPQPGRGQLQAREPLRLRRYPARVGSPRTL